MVGIDLPVVRLHLFRPCNSSSPSPPPPSFPPSWTDRDFLSKSSSPALQSLHTFPNPNLSPTVGYFKTLPAPFYLKFAYLETNFKMITPRAAELCARASSFPASFLERSPVYIHYTSVNGGGAYRLRLSGLPGWMNV